MFYPSPFFFPPFFLQWETVHKLLPREQLLLSPVQIHIILKFAF